MLASVAVELGQKVAKLLPKIGNIVANDVPVSDDEEKDSKIVSTFGANPTGEQYMHHHEVTATRVTRLRVCKNKICVLEVYI